MAQTLTDIQLATVIELVKPHFINLSNEAKKVILNVLGASKDEIKKIDIVEYNSKFESLYSKHVKTIDINNIDDSFIKVNRFLSGKLKTELNKLIKNYE
jgi:hypothetical protein